MSQSTQGCTPSESGEGRAGCGCCSPIAFLTFTEWCCLAWRDNQVIDGRSGSLHFYSPFAFQLSHTTFPEPKMWLHYSTTVVSCRCKLYFREAVDLTKQTFSKFWRTFFRCWRSLIGWGLVLLLHIPPLVVKMQLRPRRAVTVTTDSECPVWIGSEITGCGSYKFQLQKEAVSHHIARSSPGLTSEVRSGERGGTGWGIYTELLVVRW